jgi:hypothetical protein
MIEDRIYCRFYLDCENSPCGAGLTPLIKIQARHIDISIQEYRYEPPCFKRREE